MSDRSIGSLTKNPSEGCGHAAEVVHVLERELEATWIRVESKRLGCS
jgi:hypothetical protein